MYVKFINKKMILICKYNKKVTEEINKDNRLHKSHQQPLGLGL